MDATPLDPRGRYLIKHITRTTPAKVDAVVSRLDIATLESVDVADAATPGLVMNEIARVRFRTRDPLMVDAYAINRATGAFIVIDAVGNHTVAAGMIVRDRTTDG
jgi:sulfate adenylyltransferase subunit 1 (EFTu-like GTPase family)